MKRYRIGIVGSGFGASAHLPALSAHPRFEVVAIASPQRAATIAAARGLRAFGSCAAMVAGFELDAVTIASPPFGHEADVTAALAAGLHVLCEKPFALDVASADRLCAAARAAGTACGVAHEFRFTPQMQALRELIVNDHLGPLRGIEVSRALGRLRADQAVPRSWWFERAAGGGITGASLSHLVDMANWLAGAPIARSTGMLRTANARRHDATGEFHTDADDGGFALIEYAGSVVARVSTDATSAVDAFLCAAHGERRTAVASGADLATTTLYAVDADETSTLDCVPERYARFASINANVPLLMELYDAFAERIETGGGALPTFDEALATQRVLASVGYGSSSPGA